MSSSRLARSNGNHAQCKEKKRTCNCRRWRMRKIALTSSGLLAQKRESTLSEGKGFKVALIRFIFRPNRKSVKKIAIQYYI